MDKGLTLKGEVEVAVERVVVGAKDRWGEVVNDTRAVEDPARNDAIRSALEKEKVAMVRRISVER